MSVDTYGETPKIKNYWKKKALFSAFNNSTLLQNYG